MAEYDEAELDEMSVVRLKTRRAQLRQMKQNIKRESHIVTPAVRAHLDSLDEQIKNISNTIFRITGERE